MILMYRCPEAPDGYQFAAALTIPGDAYPRWWMTGATESEARDKLWAFWEKERRHYEPKAPRPKKTAPVPVEDPGDVV